MISARRFLRNHWGTALGLLAVGGFLAIVWSWLPLRPVTSWRVEESPRLLELSDDGRVLLCNVDRSVARAHHGGSAFLTFGELQVWDTSRGQLMTRLLDDNAVFSQASLAPDGRHVAVWFPEGKLQVFATNNGNAVGTVVAAENYKCRDNAFRFSPDGRTFAFVRGEIGEGLEVVIWNIEARREQAAFKNQSYAIAFSPDGRFLATVSHHNSKNDPPMQVMLWNSATGTLVRSFAPVKSRLYDKWILFSGDGKTVGLVGSPRDFPGPHLVELVAWDTSTGVQRFCNVAEFKDLFSCWTPRDCLDNWYQLRQSDEFFNLVELGTGKDVMRLPFPAKVKLHDYRILPRDGATDSESRTLFVCRNAESSGAGKLLDDMCEWLASWLPLNDLYDHYPATEISLWEMSSGRNLATIGAHHRDFCVSGNGRHFATVSGRNRIEIWDIPPRKPLGWFLGLAGLLLLLTLGGFWWQARRRKRKAALATEAIPCGTC
jgi:WD40 repeat protein